MMKNAEDCIIAGHHVTAQWSDWRAYHVERRQFKGAWYIAVDTSSGEYLDSGSDTEWWCGTCGQVPGPPDVEYV